MVKPPGRNEPCPCGSGKKFKRCCIDTPRKPVLAAVRGPSGNALTIMLETPHGVMVRRIPDAMPLPSEMSRGTGAEHATEQAASLWGLPDFICRAHRRQRGTGFREIGDRIIVIGEGGLVLQVKTREGPTDDPERERAWLRKNVERAVAQARGSIREIRAAPMRLTNARGRTFEIDGGGLRWAAVVIVDHPAIPPDFVPDLPGGELTAVVLTRQDWDFLFAQLKSTHAVASYIDRVSDEAIELGTEPLRYHDLALDDLAAKPDPIDSAVFLGASRGRTFSSPLLPIAAAGTEGEGAHGMFRFVLEDIASVSFRRREPGGPPEPIDEDGRLRVLAELDRLPITMRGLIGEYLLDGLAEMKGVPSSEIQWRLRRIVGGRGTEHLAFGVGSRPAGELEAAFRTWVSLRHHQTREALRDQDLTTVGVLLTPRSDARPWDTTMVAARGEVGFDETELRQLQRLWPVDATEILET